VIPSTSDTASAGADAGIGAKHGMGIARGRILLGAGIELTVATQSEKGGAKITNVSAVRL